MSSYVVQPIDLRLSSVLMLRPDYTTLRKALEARGYTPRDQVRGTTMTIAVKGSVEILSDVERRTMVVRSETSTRDLLIASEDLEQANRELGFEESNTLLYEFLANFSVISNKSPLKTTSAVPIDEKLLRKLGSILGKDLTPLALDLALKNENPTSTKWLRLTVGPLFVSANKRYLIRVVYRDALKEITSFIKTIEGRIKRIIDELESPK